MIGRNNSNFKSVISDLILRIDILSASCKIVVRWMPQKSIDGSSTLVQVIRQQAITWTSADQDFQNRIVSIDHNELINRGW